MNVWTVTSLIFKASFIEIHHTRIESEEDFEDINFRDLKKRKEDAMLKKREFKTLLALSSSSWDICISLNLGNVNLSS